MRAHGIIGWRPALTKSSRPLPAGDGPNRCGMLPPRPEMPRRSGAMSCSSIGHAFCCSQRTSHADNTTAGGRNPRVEQEKGEDMRSFVVFCLCRSAALVLALAAWPALAQTAIKFTLDWKFEGPAAPFLVAVD